MKAKVKNHNGVDYLEFKVPEGIGLMLLPVITKGKREGSAVWTWNGDLEKPTLRPSVRTKYTNEKGEYVEIHYWLNDGVCQCLDDCTDGNAGKKLELIDI